MHGTKRTPLGEESAARLAGQLADIARLLLLPGTVAQTLHRIVGLSVASIEGCDESGLCESTLDDRASVPSSPQIAELDRLQTQLGEGPALMPSAAWTPSMSRTSQRTEGGPDSGRSPRRPVCAVCWATACSREATLGALQLYARLPAAFNATDRAQGLIFAAHAGMALGVARAQATERGRTDHL